MGPRRLSEEEGTALRVVWRAGGNLPTSDLLSQVETGQITTTAVAAAVTKRVGYASAKKKNRALRSHLHLFLDSNSLRIVRTCLSAREKLA